MISVVSAYVPLVNHPRSEADYYKFGSRLLDIRHKVLFTENHVSDCWLYQYLVHKYGDNHAINHSIADNPRKNTLAYHIVMAQKTEWLQSAAAFNPADVLVWIDFGIFHVPGVTAEIIDAFLDRADGERSITIPGCWEKDHFEYRDDWPCWRFCGGVWIVPRQYIVGLNQKMKREYVRWLDQTNNVSWEVNTLARLEQQDKNFPIWWYQADHNQTLFTNYKGAGVS